MRNIVERADLMSLQAGIPCVPVVALGKRFYPLSGFPYLRGKTSRRGRILDVGKAFYRWADRFMARLPLFGGGCSKEEPIRDRTSGKLGKHPSARALIKQSGRNILMRFSSVLLKILPGVPVSPGPRDLLLMPDMFWGISDPLRAASAFRKRGGKVVPVIFDLIPLQFPEYCHEGTVYAFSRNLPKIVDLASGILTISRSVSRDLEDYLSDRFPGRPLPVDFFYPGGDMVRKGSQSFSIRAKFDRAGRRAPFYLMVGTIQPHKGHLLVLEAFEHLWSQGFTGEIFILGRMGGKGDEVLGPMRSSSRFGKKFFVWHDANDTELDLLYRRTRSLIMASYAEGFGLPLVEAMEKAVPVIASDLPVFREVAGDYPVYFAPGSPDDLVRAVRKMGNKAEQPSKGFDKNWITWDESVKALVEKMKGVIKR